MPKHSLGNFVLFYYFQFQKYACDNNITISGHFEKGQQQILKYFLMKLQIMAYMKLHIHLCNEYSK